MRPLLDLKQITVDPVVVRQIPYGMALYYMALPLAYEEEQASVIMAHPENHTALIRLRDLLNADVVPVRGTREAIYDTLQQFYPNHWLPTPKILAWRAQDNTSDGVSDLAAFFGAALSTEVTMPATSATDLEALLATTHEDCYSLTVLRPCEANPRELVSRASSPILLVYDEARPLKRILIALRGFSSDDYTLDWLIPLIRHTNAAVTLMPILSSSSGQLQQFLNSKGMWRDHVRGCLQRLNRCGIHAQLRLCEGDPVQQLAGEVTTGDYDLLAITAEGYGEFVSGVLVALEHHSSGAHCPVLVMKPICR
jgi:hypothetical protein